MPHLKVRGLEKKVLIENGISPERVEGIKVELTELLKKLINKR